MRRFLLLLGLLLLLWLGMSAAEYLATSFAFRHWLGQMTGRGELLALVRREGIYDRDVERAWAAGLFASGAAPQAMAEPVIQAQKRAALDRLMEEARLTAVAAGQPIGDGALRHALDLLRWQFPDEKSWTEALARAGLRERALEQEVAAHLRNDAWLEASIAPQLSPNDTDVRRYFDAHLTEFQEPLRLRASHVFLAAPDGYPAEVIEAKRELITDLSQRLARGESFAMLVAQFSEDEATKNREGDLDFFSEERMLPAVFAAARQLQPGQISQPVRSRLGFHILRLAEIRPAGPLTFAEARPEIETTLANQKRAVAVAAQLAALR